MDIIIVAQYLRDIENFEGNNSRFVYLAKLLAENTNNSVEIVTSDFCHGNKTHFDRIGHLDSIKVTTCHETGYPKNVSLKRFASHRELAKNIRKYLKIRQVPDVMYVAVPSLDVAEVCAKYCASNNVRLIVDVQDLWPEAFQMVINLPVISGLGFLPMKRQADKIYAAADEIVAVSQTYANRAMQVNRKCKQGHCVYLGTRLEKFDALRSGVISPQKPENECWIGYVGTLGHSYDLTCVMDALNILYHQKGIQNIRFMVMGSGPLQERFQQYAERLKIPVTFTGMLPYEQMVPLLYKCDIAVNPIMHGAAQSIINKVGDYAAAGLPVVNTQECSEYRRLVAEYHIGVNCENGDAQGLASALEQLIINSELRTEMGQNNRRLAEERFDRATSYPEIMNLIEGDDRYRRN